MARFPSVDEQLDLILRGAVDCYSKDDLKKCLAASYESGKPLRVKLGLDPTAPDIHIGHTVVLNKMRQFQDLGHHAVLIIGDYTAMVGDPSGKSKTRKALSEEDVQAAAQSYFDQVGTVIDVEKAEVHRNGEWFGKMNFADVMRLAGKITIARILERDDFAKRYASQTPISMHELFYPLMQAYDSIAIEADVELGGTDQTFNLLLGRRLMEESGKAPQICLTTPLLPGLDGVEKMSKSLGNTIDVRTDANDMFGKTMSIADSQMKDWFTLLTRIPLDEAEALCDNSRTNPREAKDRLAQEVVARFHGKSEGAKASEEFVRRFREKKLPDDIPTYNVSATSIGIIDLMMEVGFASSKSEARRTIEQRGVRLIASEESSGGDVVEDVNATIDVKSGMILRQGKRRFVRFE